MCIFNFITSKSVLPNQIPATTSIAFEMPSICQKVYSCNSEVLSHMLCGKWRAIQQNPLEAVILVLSKWIIMYKISDFLSRIFLTFVFYQWTFDVKRASQALQSFLWIPCVKYLYLFLSNLKGYWHSFLWKFPFRWNQHQQTVGDKAACMRFCTALFDGITINVCQLYKEGQEECDNSLYSIGMSVEDKEWWLAEMSINYLNILWTGASVKFVS